jgi:hypothetical protein
MPVRKMVMQKEEIAPGIVIYKNVIPEDIDLVDEIESSVSINAVSWNPAYVKSSGDSELDTTKRDTLTIGVSYSENPEVLLSDPTTAFNTSLSKLFYDNFSIIENDYKNDFGIGTSWHDSYGILKYGVGQKFVNHIDDHPDYHRRVSFVYYINDDYDGGEINFPRFNISYKPSKNEMIIFPSTYVYNHSVNEVINGTRYAVVSWAK